jgi:hypothetical protein
MMRKLTPLACLLAVAASLAGAGTALAAFEIREFDAYPTSTQAGGHPNLVIRWHTDVHIAPRLPDPANSNDPRTLVIDTPGGSFANPHAYPRCEAAEFVLNECPVDAQIGVTRLSACDTGAGTPTDAFCRPPSSDSSTGLYNLLPDPDRVGLVGFMIPYFNSPVFIVFKVRTGDDYGLRAEVLELGHAILSPQVLTTFWGVPADPRNDGVQGAENIDAFGAEAGRFFPGPPGPSPRGAPSNSPLKPFLQMPTICDGNQRSTLTVITYDGGVASRTSPWPQMTGCGQLAFNPSLAANPTTAAADTASGVDVALTVPQLQSPTTPSPSALRATTTEFPPGFSINSSAADGKTSCTAGEARFGTEEKAQCPESAKVGSLQIHSAGLPGVLDGGIYLGEPLPGERFRLFLIADGFGLHIKLPGTAFVDRQTGQVTTSFQNLPQTPFEEFDQHFFGSERGILVTPTRCGTYPVHTTFTPWGTGLPEHTATQFFTIDSGPGGKPCPGDSRPFQPGFEAASAGNTAGARTPFAVHVTRKDGDQNLTGLSVTTPLGFSASIRGIPYCPEQAISLLALSGYSGLAEQTSSACPAASQIGTAIAGAGAGTRPLHISGKVYLAGPYKDAPLSLVAVVPAVSGPYDLGNVAVRAAIYVDPITARVTTIADPLPQILEGIVLRTRSLDVNLDRPGFALNPTNCRSLTTDAIISGDEGGSSIESTHYQVANCATLPFAPRLSMRLTGGLKRRGHPAIHAVFRAQPGEANSQSVTVTLPKGELLDNAHITSICTRPQFAADSCPSGSMIGRAEADSPLLDQPLRGSVYLRASSNKLPDLVLDLEGQVDFVLVGRVDSVKERFRTTFESLPDVPVTRFSLDLLGGKKGLLQNSESLCVGTKRATVKVVGQNDAALDYRIEPQTRCSSKARRKGRGR